MPPPTRAPTLVGKFKDHVVLPRDLYDEMAAAYHLYRAGFLVDAPSATAALAAYRAERDAGVLERSYEECPDPTGVTPTDDDSHAGPPAGTIRAPSLEPLDMTDLLAIEERAREK